MDPSFVDGIQICEMAYLEWRKLKGKQKISN